jgi:hypothetical protein
MRRSLGVALVLVSAVLLPTSVFGQQGGATVGGRQDTTSGFDLGTNYPNPFRSETRIRFDLYDEAFPEGRPARVTIRIFNIIGQYVASPTALGHSAGDGTPVIDLEYPAPGHYEAFWDGRDDSGQSVPAAVYLLELTVNGRSQVRRIRVSG